MCVHMSLRCTELCVHGSLSGTRCEVAPRDAMYRPPTLTLFQCLYIGKSPRDAELLSGTRSLQESLSLVTDVLLLGEGCVCVASSLDRDVGASLSTQSAWVPESLGVRWMSVSPSSLIRRTPVS